MKDNIIKFSTSMKTLPAEELKEKLCHLKDSELMQQGYSYIPKDKLCSLQDNNLAELAKQYFIAS